MNSNSYSNGAIQRIHFVGIAGVGMSGIAMLLAKTGFIVSGSDLTKSREVIDSLTNIGIRVYNQHVAENVTNCQILVVSSAIPEDNVEVKAAKSLGIPILKRAQMLAELMRFQKGIAVAGTHGKTTTTSFIASIFQASRFQPTVVVGGQIKNSLKQECFSQSDYFLVEADESDASFLYLTPLLAVLTSLDADHMEAYSNSMRKLKQAFIDFANQVPFYGSVVLCIDDVNLQSLVLEINRSVITYGSHELANYRFYNINQDGFKTYFDLMDVDGNEHHLMLNVPGEHNVSNAVAAIAIARLCNISWQDIKQGLSFFSGVTRRCDYLGDVVINGKNLSLIDDYGHHPKAINVTLKALRKIWPKKRLVLCFEPHRYTRLDSAFDAFVAELSQADVIILLPVYSCNEEEIPGVNSQAIVNRLARDYQIKAHIALNYSAILELLEKIVEDQDILLAQGAGSISKYFRNLYEQVKA